MTDTTEFDRITEAISDLLYDAKDADIKVVVFYKQKVPLRDQKSSGIMLTLEKDDGSACHSVHYLD